MGKKETISLSSLKSSNRGKNIDGKELRDFGNGKMEFDPSANGFFPKEENRASDRENALAEFDKQMERRKQEVEEFNNLIDKYDGVLTEEDYLRETGKEYIIDNVGLRMTDKEREEVEAERAANRKKKEDELKAAQEAEQKAKQQLQEKVTQFPTQENVEYDISNDDLDDIEREILAEEDNIMPVVRDIGETTKVQNNTMQPMGTSDTFVDPNLARKKTVQEQPQVIEEEPIVNYLDEEAEEVDEYAAMEEEILSDEDKIIVTDASYSGELKADMETYREEEPENSAVTGKVDFIAPKQQSHTVDENGMTEEEKDLAAMDDDTLSDDDDDTDTYWKKVGAAYKKKVKPVMRKLDLNAAVVSSEPVTVSTIVNKNTFAAHSFTWVLPVSGRPYTMKSFTAAELNSLGNMAGSATRARDIIKSLWDHIIDGKGDNFDQWCKVTSHKDLVHLWFGVYGACFDGANFIPYVCDKCKEATISDNVDVFDMVEYKDDATKERIESIRSMNFEPDMGKVQPVVRVQISDDIVIDFKDPSVYDILTSGLIDRATREKYPEGTAMVPYIANIFFVDTSSGQLLLRPLNNKVYPGNDAKTLKRKAIEYSMVIRSLNSEQYSTVSNYIAEMSETDEDLIKYVYPAYTCDHCHETIDKVETSPSEMVFTRHRLALTES